ncbi:MAG: ABC transporter permease subunit [Planctomycetes bacterium]|nr:ABC transporter permease subunit [Planctomycetota bacterium]NOG54730.1 ABC transporter permease subunit [Planctomycetota bacterium]
MVDRWASLAMQASGQTGRDYRRAMRAVKTAVYTEMSKAALPNVLSAKAAATRTDRKAFYYVQIPFGRGVLAGGLTLMLVVLPVLIVSAQEALRGVPSSLRQGSLALGATRWQTIYRMTLPAAIPGIMTGAILSISRAIGEAAPILIIAGIVFIRFTPHHLMDEFTAMPLQIFDWAGRPQEDFHDVAAAGILVLLGVLLTFNATAVLLRHKYQRGNQ